MFAEGVTFIRLNPGPHAEQVEEGQCGSCGIKKPAPFMFHFWFTRLVSPPGMEGCTLICDDCKTAVMAVLGHMPDRGEKPLKGYT